MTDVLSDVGDAVFGSSGSPGRVEDVTPEQFRKLRGPLADALRGFIDSGGGPSFGSEFTADLTDQERRFLDQIGQQTQPSESTNAARDLMTRTISGDFLSPESNPFLQATIESAQRPTLQNFQDVVMPRLRSQFTQAGQRVQEGGSSPFDRAAAIASRGLAQSLGDISTNIASQNFQAERGRQMEAAQSAPAFDQAELEHLVTGMEASALPRMIEQFGIDRGLEEFRRRTDALLSALQMAGGLSSPNPVQFQPTPGTSGLLQGAVEGFSSGFGSSLAGG